MASVKQKGSRPIGFWADFRRSFVRGLATALPTLLTIALIVYVFNFVQNRIGDPINTFLINVLHPLIPSMNRDQLAAFWQDQWYLRAVGFVAAVVGVYLIGRLVASFVGQSLWKVIEQTLTRAPVIKQIYPNVKQVTDFLLSESRFEFSRVVAVEYPRKGVWSMGLVTGTGLDALTKPLGRNMLTVFVPSSPTPVTGYTITIRRDEVIDLPMTIDEALRFTVSGGVLAPPLPGATRGRGDALAGKATAALPAEQPEEPATDEPGPAVEQEKDS